MTPKEAAALLTVCAGFDNRKPDPDTAKAWSLALNGLDFIAARDAVVAHYSESREWIMPADIRNRVRRERAARIEDEVFHPPANLDPDDVSAYIRWLDRERRAVGDGAQPTAPPVGEFRDVRELGVGRTNALPAAAISDHASRARAAIREQVSTIQARPEPEPLLLPEDHSREPEPAAHRVPDPAELDATTERQPAPAEEMA